MKGRRSISLPVVHPKDEEHKFGAFVAANAAHAQTQTATAKPPTQAQNAETQTAIPPFSVAAETDSTIESPRKSAHAQTEALESSQAAHVQTQTFETRVFRRRSTSAPSVQFVQFQPNVLVSLQGGTVTSSSATDVQSSEGPSQTSTPPSPRKGNTTPRPELLTIPTQTSLPASPVGSRQISPRETPRACRRDNEAVPEIERQDYANPVALMGQGHADQKAAHSAENDHTGTQPLHHQEHEFHGGDTTFGIIEEANRSHGCDRDKNATRMSVRRRYVNSRELLGPSRTKKKAQTAKKGHGGRYRNSPRSPGSSTPNSESPTVTPRLCPKDRDATPRSARKGYQNPKALKPDQKYKRSHAQTQTQRWRSSRCADPSDNVAEELPTTPRYCPRDRDPVPKSARRISPAARGRAIRKPQPPPSRIFQGCFGGCVPEESRKPFNTNPKYPSPKFPKVESAVTQHPNYKRGLNQKYVRSQAQEKILPPAKPPPPRPPSPPAAVVPIGTQTEPLDPIPVAAKVVSSVGCCTVHPIGVATAVQVSSLLPALKSTPRSKTRSPSPVQRKEPHTFYLKLKQITETSDVDGWHYKENNKDATLSTPKAEVSLPAEPPQTNAINPASPLSSPSKPKLRSPHSSKPPTPRGDGNSKPPTPRTNTPTRQHVELSAPIVDVHCQREKPNKTGARHKFKKYGKRIRERGRRASKKIKAGGLVATHAIQQGGRRASALLQERGKGCFMNMGRCFAKRL